MSMQFGNAEVPTEILEHILDYLHDNAVALRASSLVQRSWVPTTRLHLFNEEVICQGRSPRREPMDNATAFVELCRSPFCTVLGAIHSAIVMVVDLTLDKAVIDALDQAPNLKKLVYINAHRGSQSLKWLSGKLPMVKDLVYNAVASFDEEAVGVVSSFTNIRSLAIYTTDSCRPTFPIDSCVSPNTFSNLRRLRTIISRPEEMLRWLLGSFPSIQLEELELRVYSPYHRGWGPIGPLNAFLASQAGTLGHFSLSVEYRGTIQPSYNDEVLNLTPLTLLSTLKFRTHDLRAVQFSLATLASPSVEELQVDYMYRSPTVNACGCDAMQETIDLASVTENEMLSQAHLRLGHWEELHRPPGPDLLLDIFEKRTAQKRISFFDSVIHDTFQPDSFDALSYRIVKRTIRPDSG